MIKTVKGLVINTVKYGDYDKLVSILSDDGMIFFRARGIRSLTSKNAAGCREFCYSEFILEVRGDKIYLRKAQPMIQTVANGSDIKEIALASYFAEICGDTARDAETASAALKLIINALFIISKKDRDLDFIKAVFEMRLLKLNGFSPLFGKCSVCGNDAIKADKTYFDTLSGNFICPDCIEGRAENTVMIKGATVSLMERSISEPDETAYAVKVPEDIAREFYRAAEKFTVNQYEKKYKTLDFYKEVKKF